MAVKRAVVSAINGKPLWFGASWLLTASLIFGCLNVVFGVVLVALGKIGDGFGGISVGLWMLAARSDMVRLHDLVIDAAPGPQRR